MPRVSEEQREAVRAVRSYFAALPPASRRVLKELRALIRASAPDAVEAFSYRIPGFRLDDRAFLWYAAWKEHVSLYPVGAGMKKAGGPQLARFKLSKGTVRFPLEGPLPVALIKRLIRARVAEVRAGRR